MPTLYHVTEWNKPFVALTNPPALHNVSKAIGYDFVAYSLNEFVNRKIDKDTSNEAIFVFEAAYPQMANMSMKELRKYVPNGKFVCLGGDTIWFLRRNQHHIDSPFEVDLWLDLMDEVAILYNKMGINADTWMWTISQSILDQCEEYTQSQEVDFDSKVMDFISFITVSTDYRKAMVEYFNSKKRHFAVGVNCASDNAEGMIGAYRQAWFHLGTTSPSWTTGIRTMKGFRDWLAPALNTVLIYDDFPDVRKRYGGGSIVPLYDYTSFASADLLMSILKEDRELYSYILQHQKLWLGYNTLEKQFLRRFRKHGIISSEKSENVQDTQLAEV